TMLTFETGIAALALKNVVGCEKINTGALGNIVRQLHLHVIARNTGDPAWPGPVWGHGTSEPYDENDAKSFAKAILDAI
ncbi:MAG: HIT family protein, partial [Phyllobacterium sp.]